MELFVLGINHKNTSIGLRERFAFTPAESRAVAARLIDQGIAREAVILSTCNRTEVYGVAEDAVESGMRTRDFICRWRQCDPTLGREIFGLYVDQPAIRHLFRVAASLESMVIGEPQILGQVRQAYRFASEDLTTGPILDQLFQAAVRVGKRARTETRIGHRSVSIASVTVDLLRACLGVIGDRSILVLGAGEMGEQLAKNLHRRGASRITISNRSPDRAALVANLVGGRVVSWELFPEQLALQDVVITSVQAERYILDRRTIGEIMVRRGERPLDLFDLGVPRNIDPQVRGVPGVVLHDLDDLEGVAERNKRARLDEIPQVERIIEAEVQAFLRRQQRLSHPWLCSGIEENSYRAAFL